MKAAHNCEPSLNQATVYFGDSCEVALDLTLVPDDGQTLLEELTKAHKRSREQQTRIYHLEQALDQAMACIEELRSQVQNQQLLETQLADTEEYASVQQQAITRIKLQLVEQQQALDAQILETQQRDQAIQELLATIEGMTQAQQREVERLRSRLAQDQREVQTHRSRLGKHLQDLQTALESRQQRVSELEVESLSARTLSTRLQHQLETAHQQIKDLSTRLSQNCSHLTQLGTQLEQSHAAGLRAHSKTDAEGTLAAAQPGWVKTLPADELEKRFVQQLSQQARWQQQQQELEAEQERRQTRIANLEQQVAEMQEQILQQAQQETEYETAVQYWKDRHTSTQTQILHLQSLAEQILQHAASDQNPLMAEFCQAVQTVLIPEANRASGLHPSTELGKLSESNYPTQPSPVQPNPESKPIVPIPLPRLTTVELPEFLVRRRAAQKASAAKSLPDPQA